MVIKTDTQANTRPSASWASMLFALVVVRPKTRTATPKYAKGHPMPCISQRSLHYMILFYGFLPIGIHQLLLALTLSTRLHGLFAFILYAFGFQLHMRKEGYAIHCLSRRFGFLDSDVRDRRTLPTGLSRIKWSFPLTIGSRTALILFLAYNPNQRPIDELIEITWWLWLFIHISLYSIILDFWYYCIHRAWHEVPLLWSYHQLHHTIKHPNIRLTAFADHEQELTDNVGVPALAYMTIRAMGVPFGFFAWWICLQYVTFTEVIGHSGLRLYYTPPLTFAWLLQLLHVELVIEDHDLHHRKGWRKAYNYGKQTRIWDRLFGTCGNRLETIPSTIDRNTKVSMPML